MDGLDPQVFYDLHAQVLDSLDGEHHINRARGMAMRLALDMIEDRPAEAMTWADQLANLATESQPESVLRQPVSGFRMLRRARTRLDDEITSLFDVAVSNGEVDDQPSLARQMMADAAPVLQRFAPESIRDDAQNEVNKDPTDALSSPGSPGGVYATAAILAALVNNQRITIDAAAVCVRLRNAALRYETAAGTSP